MRGRGSFAGRGRARRTRPDPGTGEPGPAKVFKQYYSGTFAARPVSHRRFSTSSPFFPRFSPYPPYSLFSKRRFPSTGPRFRTTPWSVGLHEDHGLVAPAEQTIKAFWRFRKREKRTSRKKPNARPFDGRIRAITTSCTIILFVRLCK